MKTISLWQPWASLMASGAKHIETRSWRPYGLQQGDLVAIHAARHWTAEERDLCQQDPVFRRYLTLAERRGLWSFSEPPLGVIIAIARFKEAVPTNRISRRWLQAGMEERQPEMAARIRYWVKDMEQDFGNYAEGRWAWVFDCVRPIQPIPFSGKQGLFDWPHLEAPIEFLEERHYAPWAKEVQST